MRVETKYKQPIREGEYKLKLLAEWDHLNFLATYTKLCYLKTFNELTPKTHSMPTHPFLHMVGVVADF